MAAKLQNEKKLPRNKKGKLQNKKACFGTAKFTTLL